MRTRWPWPAEAGPSGEGAGALAFDYGSAWKWEALTAQGQCVCPRWRRKRGEARRLAVRDNGPRQGDLHGCEGEVTALALAVQCAALGKGFALATGGTSGFQVAACQGPEQRPVRDPCRPGPGGTDRGAGTVSGKLRESGRTVAADGLYPLDTSGIDAADVRAAEAGERASILKYDGGLSEDESRREGRGGSVGRATAREIKTLSQAWKRGETEVPPWFSAPGEKISRGWGGGHRPRPARAP